MAKQENKTQSTEATMPVHPDPNKETIMLRYPNDGSVKVVSDLKMENDGAKLTTVEPSIKNQAAFYQRRDSRFIANFFANFRAQAQNPRDVPELFIVPFALVGKVTETLINLQNDPKDEQALETLRQYRTSTQSLEKIIYDEARMPKGELQAAGFDIEQMAQDGAFKEMELGKSTSKLYPLTNTLGEHFKTEGVYSIRSRQDENGEIHFSGDGALAMPEFILDENLRMELGQGEKEALRMGKTLDRLLKHDDQYCYAGFNRQTNRMIYVPCKEVRIPTFLYNKHITAAQREELGRGASVLLEDCHYFNSDNNFKGKVQFDVHRMEFNIDRPVYEKAYIPDILDKQLTKEQREALVDRGETLDARQFVTRDGKRYTGNLRLNPKTNGVEFVNYQRPEESHAQAQGATQSQSQEQTKSREQFEEQSAGQDQIPETVASKHHL